MTLTATTVSTSLLLTENRSLRFATFFYLYVMQGVPAGFATTALANYLAGQNLSSARVGEFGAIVCRCALGLSISLGATNRQVSG